MRWVPGRRACALFSLFCASLVLASCGGGSNAGQGGVSTAPPINHPPVAANDVLRADGAALTSINVLANDQDPDGDHLTVAITGAPSIGTATVNADNTVQIASLPSDFKGVTTFSYKVTDPSGASASASAAIFVGTDPFRVVFAGDATGSGSPEVYLTDLAAAPVTLSAATQGTLRLQGFAASADGSTVAYRRADPAAPATTDLSFVQTATPAQQTHMVFPGGAMPVLDANGRDQFVVSSDGKWIAAVAGTGDGLYLISVASPSTVTLVSPPGTVHASQPRFVQGSASLYFLATSNTGNTSRILYTLAPASPSALAQVSASVTAGSDDVTAYSVASDQSHILLQANRGGQFGIYAVDPAHLQTEIQISHTLALGETILESTVGLPADQGGSALEERVAYTTQSLLTFSVYVADVSASPAPHQIATSGARTIGFRPDDAALLYSRSAAVYESPLDGSGDTLAGAGAAGWYDSTGNIVILKQFLPSGGSPSSYTSLASTVRGSFGTTLPLGSPVLAADYFSVSGVSHGVAIIGEGPTTGAAPASAQLVLVNAIAPDKVINLATFQSPLNLTSDSAQVVSSR